MTFTKFQVKGQRSPQGQMSRSQGHHITRSQGHCIALEIYYCSWLWPIPWTFDLEMTLTLTFKWPLQNSRSKVRGHLKVKCWGHKVIVLLYRYLTVNGLDLYPGHLTLWWSWPWPLNDLHKIPGQRSKFTLRSHVEVTRSSNYKVTRSSYYKVIVLLYRYLTVQNRDWRLYSRF